MLSNSKNTKLSQPLQQMRFLEESFRGLLRGKEKPGPMKAVLLKCEIVWPICPISRDEAKRMLMI